MMFCCHTGNGTDNLPGVEASSAIQLTISDGVWYGPSGDTMAIDTA